MSEILPGTSDMPTEGRQQIERGMRQQARRLRAQLAKADLKLAAKDREIETLATLNRSQAERIDLILRERKELREALTARDLRIAELEGLLAARSGD